MVHPQQIACDGSEYTTPENASEHFLWRTGKEICPNATDGYRCIGGIKHAIDACAAGTYLDGETLECARCEVGHFCVDGAKVPCPEGFFTYRTDAAGGDDCFKCPPHFVCNPKGEMPGTTGVEDHFWTPPRNITEASVAFECLNEDACLPGTIGTDVRCRADKGYTGRMCGICCRNEDGGAGDGALYCRGGDDVQAENYARVLRRCRKCPKKELRLPGAIAAAFLGYMFLLLKTSGSREAQGASAAMWRMLISFYTVSAKLGEFRIAPPKIFDDFMEYARLLADGFDFASASPACLGKFNYVMMFLGNAVLPYAIVAAVGLGVHPFAVLRGKVADAWDRCRGRHTKHKLQTELPLRARMIGAFVWLLYFLFPSIITSLFKVFHCTPEVDGVRYLQSDLSIECYGGQHASVVMVAAVLLICYIWMVPFVIWYVTTRSDLQNEIVMAQYGFLYGGFRIPWWEIIVIVRKTFISAILVFTQHRLLQSFFATWVMVVALSLHLQFMPYDKGLLNRLELLSILSTLCTQLLNILFYTSKNDTVVLEEWKEVALGLVLVAVNVDTIVVFLLYLLYQAGHAVKGVATKAKRGVTTMLRTRLTHGAKKRARRRSVHLKSHAIGKSSAVLMARNVLGAMQDHSDARSALGSMRARLGAAQALQAGPDFAVLEDLLEGDVANRRAILSKDIGFPPIPGMETILIVVKAFFYRRRWRRKQATKAGKRRGSAARLEIQARAATPSPGRPGLQRSMSGLKAAAHWRRLSARGRKPDTSASPTSSGAVGDSRQATANAAANRWKKARFAVTAAQAMGRPGPRAENSLPLLQHAAGPPSSLMLPMTAAEAESLASKSERDGRSKNKMKKKKKKNRRTRGRAKTSKKRREMMSRRKGRSRSRSSSKLKGSRKKRGRRKAGSSQLPTLREFGDAEGAAVEEEDGVQAPASRGARRASSARMLAAMERHRAATQRGKALEEQRAREDELEAAAPLTRHRRGSHAAGRRGSSLRGGNDAGEGGDQPRSLQRASTLHQLGAAGKTSRRHSSAIIRGSIRRGSRGVGVGTTTDDDGDVVVQSMRRRASACSRLAV